MKIFFKLLVLVLCNFLALSLISCNTVKGMGQDLQQGGQELQKAAEKNQ